MGSKVIIHRRTIAALAVLAFAIAAYLALVQLHAVAHAWDPVFDGQSDRVLDSSVSRAIRHLTGVPDAALGALAYLAEIALCLLAPRRRWLEWLLIVNSCALAIAGLALVALQAFVVHAWCSLCLATAAISIAIVALAFHRT